MELSLTHSVRVLFVECRSDFRTLLFEILNVSQLRVCPVTCFFTQLVLIFLVSSYFILCFPHPLYVCIYTHHIHSFLLLLLLSFLSLLLKSDTCARYSGRALYLPFYNTFAVLPDYLISVLILVSYFSSLSLRPGDWDVVGTDQYLLNE